MKIREKRAEVLIFGHSEEDCVDLESFVHDGMEELGVHLEVKTITGDEKIRAYGISRSPAMMIVDYKLKTQGASPTREVVKEWIKEVM
jgi:hypothetical protein